MPIPIQFRHSPTSTSEVFCSHRQALSTASNAVRGISTTGKGGPLFSSPSRWLPTDEEEEDPAALAGRIGAGLVPLPSLPPRTEDDVEETVEGCGGGM